MREGNERVWDGVGWGEGGLTALSARDGAVIANLHTLPIKCGKTHSNPVFVKCSSGWIGVCGNELYETQVKSLYS